ncbi:MAG TPA: hypothetical protein VNW29_06910 [Candidatus Sulfotelmatobacter sp.]|jgi:hypothetical protein|nr:hypothetical protein [Candidatus Sulfotelmatobacter sp.]
MTRILFDKDQKNVQIIFVTSKFKNKVKLMFDEFSKVGCPVPKELFSNMEEYQKWKFDKLYNTELTEIEFIEDILQSFNLDPNNEQLNNALKLKIFLNIQLWPITNPLPYSYSYNKNQLHIEIKLTKDTPFTKEDFDDLYNWICFKLEKQPGKKRNVFEKYIFERNAKLYEMFLETERDLAKGIKYDKTYLKSSSVQVFFHPDYPTFEKKYGKIEPDNARNIISDFEQQFGHLNLVDK